jgi:hypothetical protein
MNLTIKPRLVRGRSILSLCDEDGVPLPMQESVKVSEITRNTVPRVQVTFVVDGSHLSFFGAQKPRPVKTGSSRALAFWLDAAA